MEKYLWMSSAAVVIGTLRVKLNEYTDRVGGHPWLQLQNLLNQSSIFNKTRQR